MRGMQIDIRTLRRKASLTQKELALRLEVNQSAISQWETGRTLPDLEKLPKLAQALGVSIQELFPGQDTSAFEEAAHISTRNDPSDATGQCKESLQDNPITKTARIDCSTSGRSARAVVPLMTIRSSNQDSHADDLVGRDVEVPSWVLEYHPNARAYIVDDDLMNRIAPKGSVAVYDPNLAPTNNRVVIIETEDKGAIMRRWHQGTNTLMLTSDSFQPGDDIIIRGDLPVRLVGTVVYVSVPPELL